MSFVTSLTDNWLYKFILLGCLLALHYYLNRPGSDPRRHTGFKDSLQSFTVVFMVMFFLVQPFVAQAYYIPTGSMENTLPPDDRILTSKLVYKIGNPHRGDVVVFEAPESALRFTGQPAGTIFVKRCIGVPGDVVEIRDRKLLVNGRPVAEPYTRWSDGKEALTGRFSYDMKVVGDTVYSRQYDWQGRPGPWGSNGRVASPAAQDEITAIPPSPVPSQKFLMLGDHRNASADSHYWGFVDRSQIVSKAFAVFWPPKHWGTVDRKSQGIPDWNPVSLAPLAMAAALAVLGLLAVGNWNRKAR